MMRRRRIRTLLRLLRRPAKRPPPKDFARVADIVDDSVVYYAIKLDPKKPVTAVTIENSDYKPEILD